MYRNRKYSTDEVYQFIIKYKTENDGNSPTRRDIVKALEMSSLSIAQWHVNKLAEMGLIDVDDAGKIYVHGGSWKLNAVVDEER